jgi:hypothetical protein
MTRDMRGERTSVRVARMPGRLDPQETQSLPYRNAAFQQEGTDLINNAGALTDQAFTHAVKRLQVELVLVATNFMVRGVAPPRR